MLSRENITINFEVENNTIKSEPVAKLLGINKNNELNFKDHTSLICKKAARQINTLQRISKHIDYTSKLRIYKSFFLISLFSSLMDILFSLAKSYL